MVYSYLLTGHSAQPHILPLLLAQLVVYPLLLHINYPLAIMGTFLSAMANLDHGSFQAQSPLPVHEHLQLFYYAFEYFVSPIIYIIKMMNCNIWERYGVVRITNQTCTTGTA